METEPVTDRPVKAVKPTPAQLRLLRDIAANGPRPRMERWVRRGRDTTYTYFWELSNGVEITDRLAGVCKMRGWCITTGSLFDGTLKLELTDAGRAVVGGQP